MQCDELLNYSSKYGARENKLKGNGRDRTSRTQSIDVLAEEKSLSLTSSVPT